MFRAAMKVFVWRNSRARRRGGAQALVENTRAVVPRISR
jgi:hypothetical protein